MKRKFYLALMAILLSSLMAGCNSKDDKKSDQPATTESPTATAAETETNIVANTEILGPGDEVHGITELYRTKETVLISDDSCQVTGSLAEIMANGSDLDYAQTKEKAYLSDTVSSFASYKEEDGAKISIYGAIHLGTELQMFGGLYISEEELQDDLDRFAPQEPVEEEELAINTEINMDVNTETEAEEIDDEALVSLPDTNALVPGVDYPTIEDIIELSITDYTDCKEGTTDAGLCSISWKSGHFVSTTSGNASVKVIGFGKTGINDEICYISLNAEIVGCDDASSQMNKTETLLTNLVESLVIEKSSK